MGHSGWAICSRLGIADRWTSAVRGQRPTLLDNPVQMLISPMYIFAKLFVALDLRPDLAAVLQKSFQQTPLDRLHRLVGGPGDVGKPS